MRTKTLIVNWKMNADFIAINKFFDNIPVFKSLKVLVAPSYLGIIPSLSKSANKNIEIVSQNIATSSIGNHTGSISWTELKDYGIVTSFVGHPDIRKDFNESNFTINKKLHKLLTNDMKAVIFIEENQNDLKKDFTKVYIKLQLDEMLKGIDSVNLLNRVYIVYKPYLVSEVGFNLDKDFVFGSVKIIREYLREKFGYYVGNNLPIIYGGPFVNEELEDITKNNHLDGIMIDDERAISYKFVSVVYKILFNSQNETYQKFYDNNVLINVPSEEERLNQIKKNLDFDTYDVNSEFYFKKIHIEEEDI